MHVPDPPGRSTVRLVIGVCVCRMGSPPEGCLLGCGALQLPARKLKKRSLVGPVSKSLVIVVMGVSGSGKTTVGRALARAVGGRFFDADDFHAAGSIDKMRRGIPLTDAEREPWLGALRARIDAWLEDGGITVLACSALTARARRLLGTDRQAVRLVYLHGPAELVAERMRRRDHFMRPELLTSQLAALEPPHDTLGLDIALPVDELVATIRREWNL